MITAAGVTLGPRRAVSLANLPILSLHRVTAMPPRPRPRKIRRNVAQSRDKENEAVPISDKPVGQNVMKEPKSRLYTLLVFPILLLMILHSLVTFLYVRALDPLYGGPPINLHLNKIVWVATLTGAFGPVPSPWPSLAIQSGLIALIPFSSYYTALYTARINHPSLSPTLTHLVVIFPVLYIGVSMVQRMAVRVVASFLFEVP